MQENQDFYIAEDGNVYSKEQREWQGMWISKEVWAIPRSILSLMERDILAEVQSFTRGGVGCFKSNKTFADYFGVGEQTITNSISKLKKLGLIKQTQFNGRKRTLKVRKNLESFITNKLLKKIYSLYPNLYPDYKLNNTYSLYPNLYPDYKLNNTYKKINSNNNSIINNTNNMFLKKHVSGFVSNETKTSIDQSLKKRLVDNISVYKKEKPVEYNKNKFPERMILLWNSLKDKYNTSCHKRNTKTAEQAIKYINQLSKGTFGKHNYLDKKFLKDFHINPSLLNKKFSKQEIKQTILSMAHCHSVRYATINKDRIPKSLSGMIYCPSYSGTSVYQNMSWFFSCYVSPPLLIEKKKKELSPEIENLVRTFYRKIEEYHFQEETKPYPEQDYLSSLIQLNRFFKERENKNRFYQYYKSATGVLGKYLEWLQDLNLRDFHPAIFHPNSNLFKRFEKQFYEDRSNKTFEQEKWTEEIRRQEIEDRDKRKWRMLEGQI